MNTPTSSSFNRLEGKVAVITGGASGIGACTAKLFVQNGAKVIIRDIQDDLMQMICRDIGSENVSYVHCDVTKDMDVKNLVDTAVSKYGRLHIMYSNAGIGGRYTTSILDSEIDDWESVIDVNLKGGFLCAKQAARVMVPAKKGVILFTASVAAEMFGMGSHAYAVSKAGIIGLTKNLCVDLGKHGIRVNCVSPHVVATALPLGILPLDDTTLEEVYESTAMLKGNVLKVDDVAKTALFLAKR